MRAAHLKKKWSVVDGGRFRGASVRNGYRALSPELSVVLVHDAARPMIDPDVIRRVEKASRETGVALAAWPLPDTLKQATSHRTVRRTIPRDGLWLAQTPQGFRQSVARSCLLHPSPSATDDAALAERKGFSVRLVLGSPMNFKITYPYEMRLCRLLLDA
jgi:2-C-methyl-D-erythritol 4-phosphate cytidylyltransferase